jgi:arabinan endo-1,5-alpha-L-arabinosidase
MSLRRPLAALGALAFTAAVAIGAPASGALAGAPGGASGGKPGEIAVVGDTSPIHDPALTVDDDGTWWVYSTGLVNRENGGTVQMWSSHDRGTTWAYEGTVWDEIPAWIDEHFADGALPGNLWAPEVYEHDGTYYLYYSASRFGTNNSVTALATNTTLDPDDPDYEWVDQGPVITSPAPIEDGKEFNAIDAGIVTGKDGTPYMAIGSHWYGIFLVEISWPSGKPVAGALENAVHLVDRFAPGNRVEAPYIAKRGGWYYLYVSFDACCAGADSTYKVVAGRRAVPRRDRPVPRQGGPRHGRRRGHRAPGVERPEGRPGRPVGARRRPRLPLLRRRQRGDPVLPDARPAPAGLEGRLAGGEPQRIVKPV